MKKFGAILTTAALALTPAAAGAKKHTPCGKTKPAHTNCARHNPIANAKAKAKGKGKGNTGGYNMGLNRPY